MTRLLLATLLTTFVTIIGIFNLYTAQASMTSSQPRTQVIGGRWPLVRSSLGLEPLPTAIAASTPLPAITPRLSRRINFRWRKRAVPAPLHFTRDALREPRTSLQELVVSFRRTANEEAKADAMRPGTKKGRSRLRSSLRKSHITRSH